MDLNLCSTTVDAVLPAAAVLKSPHDRSIQPKRE